MPETLTRAAAWARRNAWAVGLGALGLLVLLARFALGRAEAVRLRAWVEKLRAEKHAAKVEARVSESRALDAHRAKILHEATKTAEERARLSGEGQASRETVRALEERVRGLSAEDVAREFRRLEDTQ